MRRFYLVCYVAAMEPVAGADIVAVLDAAGGPESTASAVTVLQGHGTTFHLVGTAHVSAQSVADVRDAIHRIKPQVVCVELCRGRYDALTEDRAFRDLN